jgi:hypothetical protein
LLAGNHRAAQVYEADGWGVQVREIRYARDLV